MSKKPLTLNVVVSMQGNLSSVVWSGFAKQLNSTPPLNPNHPEGLLSILWPVISDIFTAFQTFFYPLVFLFAAIS